MSKAAKAHLDELYKDPLPLPNVVLLPSLGHNPLSLAIYLYHYLFPRIPSTKRLRGVLDEETCSVWIQDQKDASTLWFSGFFGKGQFSRSEPSWYIRTQRSLGLLGKNERLTSEEITARRRAARAEMKAERARKEKEELEAVLLAEGKLPMLEPSIEEKVEAAENLLETSEDSGVKSSTGVVEAIPNLENLQLTLYEALFLSLSLDSLDVYHPASDGCIDKKDLPLLFTKLHAKIDGSTHTAAMISTNSHFLIQYSVYHHYRSLGWTVKPAVKFGVDWLLYKRGPVFSHAEFSIVVTPSPSAKTGDDKPWWWLHMLSRVNGQVKKTIILAYVEFDQEWMDLGNLTLRELLGRYKIREVSIRRWIPSRNRD